MNIELQARAIIKKSAPKKAAKAATITLPQLGADEHYAGIVIENGKPHHHLILLPGELDRGTWQEAGAWAKKQGGELPTRREQSILFSSIKEQFQSAWYWSGEQYAPTIAWSQDFDFGSQYYFHEGSGYRARAIRRLAI